MAKLFVELLFGIIRIIVMDLLWQVVVKFCTWLEQKITGRWPRFVGGGILGLAAFFVFPIVIGLLGF